MWTTFICALRPPSVKRHTHWQRGQGWGLLTFDTTPGYTDTHLPPAAVITWKYRAIYRVDDAQVGQWSAVVSIAVGG